MRGIFSSFLYRLDLLILCFFCIPAVMARQQSLAPQTQGNARSAADPYSQESVVIDDVTVKVRLENDGRGTVERSVREKIQAESAVRSEGLLLFPYLVGDESLDIKYIRVRKPDGSVVETPLDSVQDLSSDVARAAPMYTNQHEKHAAVRGLAVGDTLEFRSILTIVVPTAPGQFWYSEYFLKAATVLHEQLEVNVPKDRPLKIHSLLVKPTIADQADRRTYAFQYSHLTKDPEPDKWQAALDGTPYPDVEISSFVNWDQVAAWYYSLQKPRVQVTSEIRAKAEELTRDKKTDAEKIQAIYDYVSTKFRYIGISLGQGRYVPHLASEVLTNGFGDCKDKHTLIAALLQAAGISSYPVLIHSSIKLDPETPTPAVFDHLITAVPQGNTFLWLDTTPGVAPLGFLSRPIRDKFALVVTGENKGLLVKTPAGMPFPAYQRFTMDASLDREGTLDGKAQVEARGEEEVFLRLAFRNTGQAQWKELAQGISNSLGFAGTVDNVTASSPDDTSGPFSFTYTYHRPEFSDFAEHQITLPIPPIGLPPLSKQEADSSAAMPLGAVEEITYKARIKLPPGFVATLPPSAAKKTDFAEYSAVYNSERSVLEGTRCLHLLMKEVPETQRSSYVSFYKAIDEDVSHWIVLQSQNAEHGLPRSNNPEAQRLFDEASQSLISGAPFAAVASIQQALKLDPDLSDGWALLGDAQSMTRRSVFAVAAFRKAVALDPSNDHANLALARILGTGEHAPEALEIYRNVLKKDPEDRDAAIGLAAVLVRQGQFVEARPILEKFTQNFPDARAHFNLGEVYVHLGEEEKAGQQFEMASKLQPGAGMLNDIAYELADANRMLPKALSYAQQAVSEIENQTTEDTPKRLTLMGKLAAYWDTLGWIYFRQGDLNSAARYLAAAWKLSRAPAIGEHLGEIYEKQGDEAVAKHTYWLALGEMESLDTRSAQDLREQITSRLGVHDPTPMSLLKFQNESEKTRTFFVTPFVEATGPAEFLVVLQAGSKLEPKVEKIQFVNGPEPLRKFESSLARVKYDLAFPDDGPTRIVRRGILNCSQLRKDCMFVLYPRSAQATPLLTAPAPKPKVN
jgi:tetratricopeptide (TPR) repeat protein